MTFIEKLSIEPMVPFDLSLSSIVFADGDRTVRGFNEDCFSQVINVGSKLVLVKLSQNGQVSKPHLTLDLYSDNLLSIEQKQKAQQIISYIFSLDLPLYDFYSHVKTDSVMTQITQKLCGFKFPTTPTVFEALVDAIVEQQISIKVARKIEERLAVKFGETLSINGENYYAFPTPRIMIEAGVDVIRQVGLSQRKADYIFNAAQMIVENKLDLEEMKKNNDSEQIISELDEINGIGVWTAELTMLRGMQKFDILPADDFGIRRVISNYYNKNIMIKAAEARKIGEAWGEWKGLAAFYLIVAEAKGILLS